MRRKNRENRSRIIRPFKAVLTAALIFGLITAVPVYTARASHDNGTLYGGSYGALDQTSHVNSIYESFVQNHIQAMMMMTEQLVSIMMQQMFILGTFLDAEHQMEVQRLLQDMAAQAHKDFQTSFQMCEFGTGVKSIAASEQLARENSKIFDAALQKREVLNVGTGAAGGISQDLTYRLEKFKTDYCDLAESNRAVFLLCNNTAAPIATRTKDIDYGRMVGQKYTLDANYTDTAWTPEEEDLIALGRNLYGHRPIDWMPEQMMNETAGMSLFMETRSIHAIRSVARRSFAKIVGLKAEGDENAHHEIGPFMHKIIEELGVPTAEINDFLGENPSYFAQMEVLTRKIYQSPEFFTNLYDKPANVRRIGVALQAIELMQDRDRFDSALRREMLISLILELKLRKYQEKVDTMLYAAGGQRAGVPLIP